MSMQARLQLVMVLLSISLTVRWIAGSRNLFPVTFSSPECHVYMSYRSANSPKHKDYYYCIRQYIINILETGTNLLFGHISTQKNLNGYTNVNLSLCI